MSNGNTPAYEVYSFVPARKEGEKKRWHRIGSAWNNRDGSINIALNAVPLTPELQLREPRPVEDTNGEDG